MAFYKKIESALIHEKIDYFVVGAGCDGTYSSVVRYLKERRPNVKGIHVDRSAPRWVVANTRITILRASATISSPIRWICPLWIRYIR